jgi:hypothetical protein
VAARLCLEHTLSAAVAHGDGTDRGPEGPG